MTPQRTITLPDGKRVVCDMVVEPDSWEISTWECNGVLERSARRTVRLIEQYEMPPVDPDYVEETPTKQKIEEDRLRNLKRNARRAKTTCRRVIISERYNELLTLTYRENQGDRELCKRHFKEWVRRMKRALGAFRYCASFERQERGAMHVHIATHKLPDVAEHRGVKIKAWTLGTRIWRDIVGADNGMCFVGGRSRTGLQRAQKMSLAKMAGYVSKYISKDFEDHPEESNRYSRSNGTEVPKPVRMTLRECSDLDMLHLGFECPPGGVVHSFRYRAFGTMWLCAEAPC